MERTPACRGLATLSAVAALLTAGAANAHPHMWIEARAQIDVDAEQRITAVKKDYDAAFDALVDDLESRKTAKK